jgi:hypothetical protein
MPTCRRTSNSAFFSLSPRITRTARLNNQRISRQAILSSTWPANHHRASPAGAQAGQRHDRVSGRHRISGSLSPCLSPNSLCVPGAIAGWTVMADSGVWTNRSKRSRYLLLGNLRGRSAGKFRGGTDSYHVNAGRAAKIGAAVGV